MSTSLCFNDITLSPVTHQNSLWIRAAELARAIGYASEKSITNIYKRHEAEFSNDMSVVINLSTTGIPVMTRIFSLRGCHLIAMFARTPVAKQFRRWVLDVLDKLAEEERAKAARNVKPPRGRKVLGPVAGMPAESPHAEYPFWVNYGKRRHLLLAAQVTREASQEVFACGSALATTLKDIAAQVDKSFAPYPDECRVGGMFDRIISNHIDAMKKQAEIVLQATCAFDSQCAALHVLAKHLTTPNRGKAPHRLRVHGDGGGYIVER